MEIICSKTGSDGNFSFITDGKTYLAIDCGVRYATANKKSGYKIIESDGMLITHCHIDHALHLKDFIDKSIHTYACQEVWDKYDIAKGYDRYKHIVDGSQIEIGTFKIKPFLVPHSNTDGTPCTNYGYLIYSTVTKEKMLWVTDCAYIENKFPTCDYICIECNYVDVEDYTEEIHYLNPVTESRRLVSHLSLNHCIDFLKKQDLSKLKFVKLLHLTRNQGIIIEDSIRDRFAKEFPDLEVQI